MHEYTSTVRIWELTCPGFHEEISRIRRWTRDLLTDSPHVDDAALIVTELTTNALLHSSSTAFHVTVTRSPRTVAISVTDAGGKAGTPHLRAPEDTEVHGRGLGLVAALAHRVRIRGDEKHGHTVSVELHNEPATLNRAKANEPSGATTC